MIKHTIELSDRQLAIIHDLLAERLEDLDEDISHYEEHPEELVAETEPGDEPLSVADYEHYRDEVQSLISALPDVEEEENEEEA